MNISFLSDGCIVKGWLFLPENIQPENLPAIVMAPGFSGTKECNYQFFAERFSQAGFAVLLFDYPNFGESSGENRGEVDPWQQVQAYRDGISFLETKEEIDKNRIAIWGGSYSGGHAIIVCALETRVRCMVAMTPFISGFFYRQHLPDKVKTFLFQQFHADRLRRVKGEKPAMIPVASDDKSQFTAFSGRGAWDFMQSFKDYAPTYQNAVTLRSLEMQLEYEPGYYVQDIGSIPKLFILAKKDEVIPEQLILAAYEKASEPKELVYVDGYHFSPYMEELDRVSELTVDWLKGNL
ncbi:MAG: alpha/beta fold hydrolase [Bacteroidetes bacterium]|nr:alpha/beta fold hydrolase [Bacteroidota bacterium]